MSLVRIMAAPGGNGESVKIFIHEIGLLLLKLLADPADFVLPNIACQNDS